LLLYFFIFLLYRVYRSSPKTQGQSTKPSMGQNRPRWPGLHPARGSASQMLGAANPKIAALQTRSPWGCSQARGFAHSAQGWADPAPSVYMLGPQLALAPGVFSLGRGQVRVASPTPRLGSPSARCLQPYHAPTKQCNL